MRAVPNAVPQHVDGAPLIDFAFQTGEEAAPRGAVVAEVEGFCGFRLRVMEKGAQLGQVHAVLAVVVAGIAADPAHAVAGGPLAHHARLRRIAGLPVNAVQMRLSSPFSLVSVVIGLWPHHERD